VTVVFSMAAGLVWYVALPRYRPQLRPAEQLGIDVSQHQGVVDWSQVRQAGFDFAYLKASEGRDFTDASFASNWPAAAAAGLARGAYHFFTLCSSGADQARHFLEVLPAGAELPPAVDLEIAGNCASRPAASVVEEQLRDFETAVEAATDRSLVLYVGTDFHTLYPLSQSVDRSRWVPRFLRRPSTSWTVWQVSSFAHVPGIDGSVDIDVRRA
jgi:lysozyme